MLSQMNKKLIAVELEKNISKTLTFTTPIASFSKRYWLMENFSLTWISKNIKSIEPKNLLSIKM